MADEKEVEGQENTEASAEAGESGGSNKMMVVMMAVLVVSNIALAGFVVMGSGGSADAAPEEESAAESAPEEEIAELPPAGEVGPMHALDAFVVNLDEPQSTRYLRVEVQLELINEEAREPVSARTPVIRDLFIGHLGNQRVATLRTVEDKQVLRDQLLDLAQEAAGGRMVQGLYFTEFIIQ